MSLRIAFIGTGSMGQPMARRLLAAGHAVRVHDPRPQAVRALVSDGAWPAGGPAEAAAGADIAFTCLPDAAAFEAVYFGPGDLLAEGSAPRVVVDVSTSGPELARRIGAHLAKRGVAFVDAPVSGGAALAAVGRLTVIASGPAAAMQAAMPALHAFGSDIFVVGSEPGQAQVVKLINNVLSYTALAATSEALVLGRKAGVDVEATLRALTKGTGRNSATDSKIPLNVLTRRFDYGASNRISHKDLSLYLDLARDLAVATPITSLLLLLLKMWMPGHEDDDMTSVARLFEGWGGVELTTTT